MTADTVGGVWTYAIELAGLLGGYGVEVDLATMGRKLTQAQRREAGRLSNVLVHETEYRLEWMSEPWADVERAGGWLLDLEQRLAPDVIHLNNYCHASVPFSAPKLVVGHSCVYSWWESVHGTEPSPEWARYHEAVTAGLAAADFVAAPSRAMLNALHRHYGIKGRYAVIPNARTLAAAASSDTVKEPFILAAGRAWDAAKNLELLDRAAAGLDWPLVVAGACESPDGRGASFRNARPLGELPAEELRDYYSRASIYALPARYEPFGLSVLEAAAHGCALVLGNIPSLRENWMGAAAFAPPESEHAVREAIRYLIREPEERQRLGRLARERSRRFEPSVMAEAYLSLYDELLREEEAGACAS
ncbi:MAG: glycosyltransferase family 4 protein [Deltaproteobacteria bacterium]|nr:glycosyltransferase family 4 protein [Deltaproteobacteria bacterium]